MDVALLQTRLAPMVKLDLGRYYEAYLAQGGDASADGFLAFLSARGIVDNATLKQLHAMTDLEIPALLSGGGGVAAAFGFGAPPQTAAPRATQRGDASVVNHASGGSLGVATLPGHAILPGAPGVAGAPGAPGVGARGAGEARFQPITKLGQGAMGAVHIARDVFLRRKVALKTLLPEIAGDEQLVGRFVAEMQITAQLEHPNIVPVYGIDVAGGAPGYAMKLVQGKDLERLLEEAREKCKKQEPLGEEHGLEKRLEHFLKVCDALEYAHVRGIIHRDLKPANVMIGPHNEVYLMDWGIARPIGAGGQAFDAGLELQRDPAGSHDPTRTRVGAAIGTPAYMSPEQAAGKNAELGARSDQYAMGLILHECVSLKRAVDGHTLDEVLGKAKEARRDAVQIGDGVFGLPREIEAIVRRATRLDPRERYPSVGALADDVRRYMRGEPVKALPEGPLRRAARWLSKHRTTSLVLILTLGLVGAGGTIGALVAGQARVARAHERELRASQMQTEAAIQAQIVDSELKRYESALTEFAGAAQVVLSEMPQGKFEPFYDELLASKATAPPDFGPSARYGRDVTILAPLASVAPGVTRDSVEPLARSLGLLAPSFRALLISSAGADWHALNLHQQRALIADVGVPVLRASIGLREGLTLSFPGMAGVPPTDPREAADFKAAIVTPGVRWGTSEGGESPTVPASLGLYDDEGAFRGVARIEISLKRLLDAPRGEDLDFVESRLLVGRDGRVVAEHNRGRRAPLPPEVVAAIAAGRSGSLAASVGGVRWQYAYYPLTSLDWYYVAAGEEGRMLASTSAIVTTDPRQVIVGASASARAAASAAPSAGEAWTGASSAPSAPSAPSSSDLPDAGAVSPPVSPNARGRGAWRKGGAPSAKPPDFPKNPFAPWKVYDQPGGK